MASPEEWPGAAEASSETPNELLKPCREPPIFTTQLELTLSCRNIFNMDKLNKSPYCIVSMRLPWNNKYHEIGRTECIYNTLNPEWERKITVDYYFEVPQHVRFEVLDRDLNGSYELLGVFRTTLSDLVANASRQYIGSLTGDSNRIDYGKMIVVTDEVSNCKQVIELKLAGENLAKQSWWCKNDPFLVIHRLNEDGSYSVVAKTNIARTTQHPDWYALLMRATGLCNGDLDRSIMIGCYDYRVNGRHRVIGTCYTSLRTIIINAAPLELVRGKKGQRTGLLKIQKIHVKEEASFLDFIRNGTQMHFAVGIDFTASNGVYTESDSLHYLSEDRPNSYEIALRSIGEIIEQYDYSHFFPAYGFGARIPPNGEVSHQFPLNGSSDHPYCTNVEEILQYYRRTLKSVRLHGPTNFAPVINNIVSIANHYQGGSSYFVLLIITDGIISDMTETKEAIIKASRLPISIIIVGVGDCSYEEMVELDSDTVPLSVDGRYAERDIVQFVPLYKFLTDAGHTHPLSHTALAKEVLAEIPHQLTSYMESIGYRPPVPAKNPANQLPQTSYLRLR